MRSVTVVACALLALAACGRGRRAFEEPRVLGGVTVDADTLNRGAFAYARHCRGCHGPRGAGDGPYAAGMEPPPRDLTRGAYPRLGATGGDLPSDEALRALVRNGLEGTPMGPTPLEGRDLEAVVQYLKTLSPVWTRADPRPRRAAAQDVQ